MPELQKFLREKAVTESVGCSRSHLWAMIAAKEFPAPVKISKRAVAWIEVEIIAWQQARIEAQRSTTKQ